MQRCIHTIKVHAQGVWTLQATQDFNTVFSSGKDQKVWAVDLTQPDQRRRLVCEEDAPVLRLNLVQESSDEHLWISTTETRVRRWPLRLKELFETNGEDDPSDVIRTFESASPLPDMTIKGGSYVKQYQVTNDKRYLVTKDSNLNVALYDVLKGVKVRDLGIVCFEDEVKKYQRQIYVPNWFSVDLKTGVSSLYYLFFGG